MAIFSSDGNGAKGGDPSANGSSGYDRVRVLAIDGQFRVLTRAEFENLPLPERVRHLMGGKLVFYRDGQEIAAREALRPS